MTKIEAYVTKWFKKWAGKKDLSANELLEAIRCVEKGLGVADLGGNLYKIRLAKEGKGKSGGYRTILIYKRGVRALFIYGFEKSDQDNIDSATLRDYKRYARSFLDYDRDEIKRLLGNETISFVEDV